METQPQIFGGSHGCHQNLRLYFGRLIPHAFAIFSFYFERNSGHNNSPIESSIGECFKCFLQAKCLVLQQGLVDTL